jgi:CHAT domain-containing protein
MGDDDNGRLDRLAALARQSCADLSGSLTLEQSERITVQRSAIDVLQGAKSGRGGDTLPSLPDTADEICHLAELFRAPSSDVFLGMRATKAQVMSLNEKDLLKQYRVVHFATHGLLSGEVAKMFEAHIEPALVLTPDQNSESNQTSALLSASEAALLKLDSEFVLLSACNTASEDGISGESLSGLARAFLYAGARSLLVSHWYVDSVASVHLVSTMMDYLDKFPSSGRAVALQKSILQFIESEKQTHPRFWAPYVIVGEGQG